jgi:cytochrome b6-f complex iron-sulfur subunit
MSDEPKNPPRRTFLDLAAFGSTAALGATVLYPVLRFVEPKTRPSVGAVQVGKLSDFPLGGSKQVIFDERPVHVVRAMDGRLRAFSAVCSHLQCVVAYSPERDQFVCPCHRGVYSGDGQNVGGPPPRPLEELVVTVTEGNVFVGRAT